ncbi:MAG: T9SS type A sorting domain-containing protein, partial [Taibaiella sp.]|nr:T9SS type A sorting domain-containing protein [Taibaiella sp.]
NDILNITWNQPSADIAAVSITDISGKVVHSSEMKMDTNAAINLSSIQPGFYFLNVKTDLGSHTQKLLIQ